MAAAGRPAILLPALCHCHHCCCIVGGLDSAGNSKVWQVIPQALHFQGCSQSSSLPAALNCRSASSCRILGGLGSAGNSEVSQITSQPLHFFGCSQSSSRPASLSSFKACSAAAFLEASAVLATMRGGNSSLRPLFLWLQPVVQPPCLPQLFQSLQCTCVL